MQGEAERATVLLLLLGTAADRSVSVALLSHRYDRPQQYQQYAGLILIMHLCHIPLVGKLKKEKREK